MFSIALLKVQPFLDIVFSKGYKFTITTSMREYFESRRSSMSFLDFARIPA